MIKAGIASSQRTRARLAMTIKKDNKKTRRTSRRVLGKTQELKPWLNGSQAARFGEIEYSIDFIG